MIGPAAGSAPSITGNGTHEPGRGRFHRVVSAPPGEAVWRLLNRQDVGIMQRRP